MITAEGPLQESETKKTYIYKLNFQCLADNIEEADKCFQKEAQLTYQKGKAGWLCPVITVMVVEAPKDGYDVSEIKR